MLAAAAKSDVDLPPFEKSAMDGFAVHSADFSSAAAPQGERTLPIVGESRAGDAFDGVLAAGTCAAIYTGAPLPEGADAVVMVEKSELEPGGERVRLVDRPPRGQHVCPRGQDLRIGQSVLHAGRRLRSADLSLLAAVGCDPLPVLRRPRAHVLTTGDELVAPSAKPGPSQIREGNTLHLAGALEGVGAEVLEVGVVRDELELLQRAFDAALEQADVLVTTGGVSMGKYDLVGQALLAIGVEPVFHKVAVKPGKPLWFGTRGERLVFALPGNPVSCLVNLALFVLPALRKLGGERDYEPVLHWGRWSGAAVAANPREQYLPVEVDVAIEPTARLTPVAFNGSADMVGISRAQALAVLEEERELAPQALVRFRWL